jgi:hypothetical protein
MLGMQPVATLLWNKLLPPVKKIQWLFIYYITSWISNYLCNQYLSPLTLWVWTTTQTRCTDRRKLSKCKYTCCLKISVMVFNATFNNISVISWRSVLLKKPEKTSDIPQVTDKLGLLQSRHIISSIEK